jgi:putative ABC transport system permease protein
VSSLPLSGAWESTNMSIEGRPKSAEGSAPVVQYAMVIPGYFRAVGIPLRRGRTFDEHDDASSPPVVLISEAAAERYWPGQDPIGQRVRVFGDSLKEIVGVVGDVRQKTLTDPIQPTIYIPYAQFPYPGMSLVVRAERDASALVPALRSELHTVDPNVTLSEVRTLRSVFDESLAQRRFSLLLVGFFAASALLLAAVGLYGVIAYGVGQRTHEIGVRMALGAQRHEVLRLILWQALALTAIGLAIGAVAAFAVTSLIRQQLFEVSPTNPPTYAAIAALLLATALLASYAPARRATRIDPMGALRQE